MATDNLLLQIFHQPENSRKLDPLEWDTLIREARRSNLLARLKLILEEEELLDNCPPQAKQHLFSAEKMSIRQDRAMRFELDCVRNALHRVAGPVILLKGAAYLAAGLPNARGRMFGDIDILVTEARIDEVESELLVHGWQQTVDNAYDQKYYREWMHEIPPLEHRQRKSVIDVHHNILPRTARIHVNIAPFFSSAEPLGNSGLFILCPEDMILHSATHLFHEGEFDNALRDLYDLHTLLIHFSAKHDFWGKLIARAKLTRLQRPLFYALRYCKICLHTPIPAEVLQNSACGQPVWWQQKLMDACYQHALRPVENSQSATCRFFRFLLYLRSHWIRMPVHLLSYHLGRKVFLHLSPEKSQGEQSV